MKPIAICSCLALAALSLYAGDPQATTAAPVTHAETLMSAPRTSVVDSPLVHAAKATNRLNKKPGQVITNETLVRSGGHFTTTTAEAQAQLPPNHPSAVPTMDQIAIEQRRARAETAAAADQARKIAAQKKASAGLAAARAEGDTAEGVYMDPPALETGTIQTAKPLSPAEMTPQQQKPPL